VTDPVALANYNAGKGYVAGTHTSKFTPQAEPALKIGVAAMTAAAIALLQN
jgi:hypothetical protein